jgi:ABC-type transport system involved in multi-copper enzyme maturation permease subunit
MPRPFWPPRLFGPVLLYDLIRLARQERYMVLRALLPIGLLLLLWSSYTAAISVRRGRPPMNQEMADLAASFFGVFMTVQFGLCFLFTPVYTAGAIAEEKDRKRVDFLFATDLHNQEIILGKLTARIANLLMLLLAGLPVLSFIELWGGIDPELLLLCYAATAVSVISLAAVSILQSVFARKAREAIVQSYLYLAAYLGFSYALYMLSSNPGVASATLFPWPARLTWGRVIGWFNAGNILVVRSKVLDGLQAGKTLNVLLPGLFYRYVFFHGFVATLAIALAILKVRQKALAEQRPPRARKRRQFMLSRWIGVGRQPMMWKELCVEPGLSFNRAGHILILHIVLGSFLPALWIVGAALWSLPWEEILSGQFEGWWDFWPRLSAGLNTWVRIVGTLVAYLTLLGVAVRAAGSLSGEHERQTYESLVSTPVSSRAILAAKWFGSIWGVRWGAGWLVIVWCIGILTGGLNLVILPWLVLAWIVYAGFFASLGLAFSVRHRSTLPATVGVLIATAFLTLGHLIPWTIIGFPRMNFYDEGVAFSLLRLQIYGLAPPIAVGWLSFNGDRFQFLTTNYENAWAVFQAIMEGLVLWQGAAVVLWSFLVGRFRRERAGG